MVTGRHTVLKALCQRANSKRMFNSCSSHFDLMTLSLAMMRSGDNGSAARNCRFPEYVKVGVDISLYQWDQSVKGGEDTLAR